ncbi:hypothetical protein [Sorangium sp. So ce341]|uniref:hypothetical protein n=1 Tax=Sorangium sp. So ce341 TaxID=3133302 RepID=UPI003F62B73E
MATSSGKDALARSLDEWRLADVSFEEADSERARAGAMLRQLQAREIVERTYWAENEAPFSLRVKAVETGLWSAEEAIDGSGASTSWAVTRSFSTTFGCFPMPRFAPCSRS